MKKKGKVRNREVQRQRKRISWQGNTVLNNGLTKLSKEKWLNNGL